MQCREDDRGQGHYGGRGQSRLLDDSTVGFVARGERDRERCTYRGQTKGNLYNDRDDGELQPSRWENKNRGRGGEGMGGIDGRVM